MLDINNMALKNVTVEEQCPTVADILTITIANYINLAVNNCGYSSAVENLIVHYVHPLFFKVKAEVRK